MRIEFIALGVVCLLCFLVGYVMGWRNGHLLGVRYAYKIYLDGEATVPASLLKDYVLETMEKVEASTIHTELDEDEIYQQQLKAQENA